MATIARRTVLALLGVLCTMSAALAASRDAWRDEIIYQIFPRSFRDSNGDRIGDLNGIRDGLPYLSELGITAILINPIAKARVYHNYFADDPMDVDPTLGTLDDFRALVRACHDRKIKVILDVEPQYVAAGFPWLAEAMSDPDSSRRRLFRSIPKTDQPSHWYNGAKVPFATFDFTQPETREYIHQFAMFWAGTGIDGVRLDHFMDNLDFDDRNQGLYAKLWNPVMAEVRKSYPNFFFLAEQADWEGVISLIDLFKNSTVDAAYSFRMRRAILSWNKIVLEKELSSDAGFQTDHVLLQFLENHDMERWASSQTDPRKRLLGAALMFTVRGAPILYYGQELGMTGIQGTWGSDGNDIPVRLAFRWGATLAEPHTPTWYKGTGPWDEQGFSKDGDGISLDEQKGKPDSTYELYRRLIALRKSRPVFGRGTQKVVPEPNPEIVRFERVLGQERVVVIANLGATEQKISVDEALKTDLWTGKALSGQVVLAPYGFAIAAAR